MKVLAFIQSVVLHSRSDGRAIDRLSEASELQVLEATGIIRCVYVMPSVLVRGSSALKTISCAIGIEAGRRTVDLW